MKNIILFLLISFHVSGQKTDTIRFYSNAFKSERKIIVSLPESYSYKAENVKFPVFYILDGQHDWFVNPVINDIEYLQYTHVIPHSIIVTVPLENRINECSIPKSTNDSLALIPFLIKEIEDQLSKYDKSDYRMLIGHSFSASFALYANLKTEFFDCIIAHSPLDNLDNLITAYEVEKSIYKISIYLSFGGIDLDQDYYHRNNYEKLKRKHRYFFKHVTVLTNDLATHTSIPILTTSQFLLKEFADFAGRTSNQAQVDIEYKLIKSPDSPENELIQFKKNIEKGNYLFVPEIAEFNAVFSRFDASAFYEHAIKILEFGIEVYPLYIDFYLQLYELYSLSKEEEKAIACLIKAREILLHYPLNQSNTEILEFINEKLK